MKKLILYTTVSLITLLLILYLLGFRITYNPNIINDWDAISAVGTWASVFATMAIAYLLFLRDNTSSPVVRLIQYISSSNPHLAIVNLGRKPICISRISFNFGMVAAGRLNAEDSNDIGGVCFEHIIVAPFDIKKIELPIILLQHQMAEFHYGNEESMESLKQQVKNDKMYICLTDIAGIEYNNKTSITFEQYCDILFKIE